MGSEHQNPGPDQNERLEALLKSRKISESFYRIIIKTHYLHDWYIKDLYLGNTGKQIEIYSKMGSSTLQMEFCTSNNDFTTLLLYVDVFAFEVSMKSTDDVSRRSFTGLGRCTSSDIEAIDGGVRHVIEFEGGNTIYVACKKINSRKIINNYWK